MNPDGRSAECRRDHLIGYGGAVFLPRAPIVSQKGRFTNRPYPIDGYAGVASFGRTASRSIGGLCPPLTLPPACGGVILAPHRTTRARGPRTQVIVGVIPAPHRTTRARGPRTQVIVGGLHNRTQTFNGPRTQVIVGGIAQQDADAQRPAHPGDCGGIAQQDANVQRPAHRMIVPVGGHL